MNKDEFMTCPICFKANTGIYLDKVYDDRYGFPTLCKILECTDCSHMYLNQKFVSSEISTLYSNFYPRSSFKDADFTEIKDIKVVDGWFSGLNCSALRWVPRNVKVLDIGCGVGQSISYHKRRDCEAWGIEADENVRSIAINRGLNIKIGTFSPHDFRECYFDYITLDQVIEHFNEPLQQLKEIGQILKINGVILLTFPNVNGWGRYLFRRKWIHWHAPYHLNSFSKESFSKMSREAGFAIEFIKTITSSEWLFYQIVHLITFPSVGEKSLFWSNQTSNLKFYQKFLLKFVRIVHKLKVFHLITRLMDFLSLGDNIVVKIVKRS